MTLAANYILIFLAILLFLHVFWIIFLKIQSKRVAEKSDQSIQTDYLIVYATQSGNASILAQQTARKLSLHLHKVQVMDIQNIQIEHMQNTQNILWFVSTYGEGDAPDSARHFLDKIMSQSIDLSNQKFAVMALGDRHYENFCEFGKTLNQWLQLSLAQPLFDMVCVDQLNEKDLKLWNTQFEQISSISFAEDLVVPTRPWFKLTLLEREHLNLGSQGNPLYRIRLSSNEQLSWKSGDIVEVLCANSLERITQFIGRFSFEINDEYLDRLKYKNLIKLPQRFDTEENLEWISRFENLPFREYSVASIVQQGYIELVVRQSIVNGELGLGSGWLTEHSDLNGEIQARIRTNSAFHLIENETPSIFIGNGSGIAGLMSHLHQREKLNHAQNWLIFGERQKEFDSLFNVQIEEWKFKGILSKVDLVFSRDGNAQKYVKDCLVDEAEQLKIWVEKGAAIYVCGSLNSMAKDVDETLHKILGRDVMSALIQEKRYLRDVY